MRLHPRLLQQIELATFLRDWLNHETQQVIFEHVPLDLDQEQREQREHDKVRIDRAQKMLAERMITETTRGPSKIAQSCNKLELLLLDHTAPLAFRDQCRIVDWLGGLPKTAPGYLRQQNNVASVSHYVRAF